MSELNVYVRVLYVVSTRHVLETTKDCWRTYIIKIVNILFVVLEYNKLLKIADKKGKYKAKTLNFLEFFGL